VASKKQVTTFNGSAIETGGYLRVEFGPKKFLWVMLNKVMPCSVKAMILQCGGRPYLQGRVMDIHLKYAREYRSKDNPPLIWCPAQSE